MSELITLPALNWTKGKSGIQALSSIRVSPNFRYGHPLPTLEWH